MTDSEAFNDLYFAVTRVLTRGSEALPELEAAHVRATAHRREAAGVARVVPARPLDDTERVCRGCGMPVGRAHADECGFARSRVVNEMQTRIAPVGGLDDTELQTAPSSSQDLDVGAREAEPTPFTDEIVEVTPGAFPHDPYLDSELAAAIAVGILNQAGVDVSAMAESQRIPDWEGEKLVRRVGPWRRPGPGEDERP